jgi:hypothetical protein
MLLERPITGQSLLPLSYILLPKLRTKILKLTQYFPHITKYYSLFSRHNQAGRSRPTALLPPRSDGKPEAATAVVVAPDDGHEDARNMLSCI